MPVRVGVHLLEGGSLRRRHRFGPARAMAGFEITRKGKARQLGFPQRPDVALAQFRKQRDEDLAGRDRTAQGRVTAGNLHAEPGGDPVQRMVRQVGIRHGRKKPHA